ncbi:MAG: carbohydrate ABC transporter permease [Lachnospiraceae bacterium]|nr:carbohydrate ABC transporter permease [Lachnospiraceae bacterium]
MKKTKNKRNNTNIFIHIFFIVFGAMCIIPFMMVVSASFTSVRDLSYHGFSILPPKVDFTAYAYLFENPKQIIYGYMTTFFVTVVGTFLSVMVMSMAAYALSRPRYKLKGIMTAYIFFPTLFSGGMVSSYIVNTRYLNLTDSIWVLILPGLVNVFHIIMLRTFFMQLPDGLFDAAMIDGAGEWRIYTTIALTLSKPVIATVSFLGALTKWNEWYNAMLYIRSEEKYPLQYLLQRMMMNIQELINSMEYVPSIALTEDIPGENLRMALLVVCIGPMMLFFPFFQKYFTKGMTVGAVKG